MSYDTVTIFGFSYIMLIAECKILREFFERSLIFCESCFLCVPSGVDERFFSYDSVLEYVGGGVVASIVPCTFLFSS